MARPLNKLTDRRLAALKEPGRHSDGGGLYLRITPQGARAWVFMATIEGKRREIGLGPESAVSLKAARRLADRMREAAALGADPRTVIASRENEAEPKIVTFGDYA